MQYCQHCGAQVTEDQKVCLECGKSLKEPEKREGFFGYLFYGLIAILLPILGFFLYIAIRIKRPKTSRFVLITSIVSLIIWILLIIFVI